LTDGRGLPEASCDNPIAAVYLERTVQIQADTIEKQQVLIGLMQQTIDEQARIIDQLKEEKDSLTWEIQEMN
jgi:hypothetical protein